MAKYKEFGILIEATDGFKSAYFAPDFDKAISDVRGYFVKPLKLNQSAVNITLTICPLPAPKYRIGMVAVVTLYYSNSDGDFYSAPALSLSSDVSDYMSKGQIRALQLLVISSITVRYDTDSA